MSTSPEESIVRRLAEATGARVAQRVMRYLQGRRETTSGDSDLRDLWDEICVQVQDQESTLWWAYEITIEQLVRGYLAETPRHEMEALFLQTEDGFQWRWMDPGADTASGAPIDVDVIAAHVVTKYVYPLADRWSNRRIRAYLDRPRYD